MSQYCSNGHDTFKFGRNNTGYCRVCAKLKMKLYRERGTAVIQKNKNKPCTDCKLQFNPWQMQYDHLRDKKFSISTSRAVHPDILQAEIAKCEVVCANCHYDRTWKRLHKYFDVFNDKKFGINNQNFASRRA